MTDIPIANNRRDIPVSAPVIESRRTARARLPRRRPLRQAEDEKGRAQKERSRPAPSTVASFG
jgi:hypothetical protein